MAINNWNNFIAAGTQEPWYANVFENALKGYKMQQEPGKMAQEKEQRELVNKLKNLEVEHKPTEYALNDQGKSLANALHAEALKYLPKQRQMAEELNAANISKAKQSQGLKGALAAAFQLRNNLNPDDPNYEKDKNSIENYINKLGAQSGVSPITQAGEGIKINLPEGKSGYVPGLGKLKTGWQPVKDAKGNDIGVNVPMSDKQIDQWKAKEKFDVIYPFINDSLSQYTGQNSWENFTNDARNYSKDIDAKERIDNYLAAKKLISIGSTTENARIGGHATNAQLAELKKTLDSSEVFNKIERGSGFVLPAKYAKDSGKIFKSYLDNVEKAAKTNIPAYEFRALNPADHEKSAEVNNPNLLTAPSNQLMANALTKNQSEVKSFEPPKVINVINGIATVKNGNKILKIPENLLDRYMTEQAKAARGDDYGR